MVLLIFYLGENSSFDLSHETSNNLKSERKLNPKTILNNIQFDVFRPEKRRSKQ